MRCAVCLAGLLLGCSSSNPGPTVASEPSMASLADESCPGFTLTGLKYSPGGTVLPHKCKAFDSLTNNPYAVRCVDAIPGYRTKFPGDEFCILPPAPDKGTLVGAHPQGASYWDKMLHEVWINVWWLPDGEMFIPVQTETLNAPIDYPPGEVIQNTDTVNATGDPLGSHLHRSRWIRRTRRPTSGVCPADDEPPARKRGLRR